VRRFQGDLRLAGLNKLTRKGLSMVGASKVFETFVNEDEAVASFAPHREDARAIVANAQ
jgi:hypothetical protein